MALTAPANQCWPWTRATGTKPTGGMVVTKMNTPATPARRATFSENVPTLLMNSA
ncbi:hypothetical protein Ari01nite_83710 [Paractinoplanes rishiriensis]|uniref:Uncharacterized protein n=1 Tax=Paractinoplanes rishiriensis TaxID=1050105 RepID=A0A919K4S8_9ACTN|nr:hypothetical protein Ari01nite_83710 [Actinoplanes rishiriensis]